MKGDFTRSTFDRLKHYTRVLKQQGRVDLDADWNEAADISLHLDRTLTRDVVGPCGVPRDSDGFRIETTPGGDDLTFSPGRIYVDGILAEQEGEAPIPITAQPDLPEYLANGEALDDGVYLVYLDVWERHVTYIEDPEIRETALGGPDTTTRTRTVSQVRLHRIDDDAPLAELECKAYPAPLSTGRLRAATVQEEDPANPCLVPAAGGYRGLENRLYRVEIHNDGRGADGKPATFKWSRDNGSVVLPVAEGGIDDADVTLRRLGHDDVLTVRAGDWVEVLGESTELNGWHGTLARVVPDGIDHTDLRVTLSRSVTEHAGVARLKMRRWDHRETDDVPLVDGAIPIQTDWFELEDGVQIRFDPNGEYRVGDYWLIPARTREGTVLWPGVGDSAGPAALPCHGIHHHYCTLALARRSGGAWTEVRDCRPIFHPLTDLDRAGGCCVTVEPGEDIQRAIDDVIEAGGGCVSLCAGVHVVRGALYIDGARDIAIRGQGAATIVLFMAGEDTSGAPNEMVGNGEISGPVGGFIIHDGTRTRIERLLAVTDDAQALVTVLAGMRVEPCHQITLNDLVLLNFSRSDGETGLTCGIRLGASEGVAVRDCRIAAEVGVLGLWADGLPDFEKADQLLGEEIMEGATRLRGEEGLSSREVKGRRLRGVKGLRVHGTTIRFRAFGLLMGRAERSRIDRCDIGAIAGGLEEEARKTLDSAVASGSIATRNTGEHWASFRSMIEPLFQRTATDPLGDALCVFNWLDGHLRGCVLHGENGVRVGLWIRGSAVGNTILANGTGLEAFWLHDAVWRSNRVVSEHDAALAIGGAYRARIDHNRVRAGDGLRNRVLGEALLRAFEIIPAFQRGYGMGTDTRAYNSVATLLVHESAEVTDLGRVLIQFRHTFRDKVNDGPAAIMLTELLEPLPESPVSRAALPLLDLRIADNDFDCEVNGVSLADLIPLGGLRIEGNRIRTPNGQAVRVEAVAMFTNARLLALLVRTGLDRLLESLKEGDPFTTIGEWIDIDLSGLAEELAAKLDEWQRGVESILGTDFRIARNKIRARRTAIEFNVFEMVVQDNHVTMLERVGDGPDSKKDSKIGEVIEALDEGSVFEDLAAAMREGAFIDPQYYVLRRAKDLFDKDNRKTIVEALKSVSERSTDFVVQDAVRRLRTTIEHDAIDDFRDALRAFVAALRRYNDSVGILARGAGCRIIGNHVLVPEGETSDAEALGGVQLALSFLDLMVSVSLLRSTGSFVPSTAAFETPEKLPFFGLAETLIANNEIIGGTGHGLAVLSTHRIPERLENLQIRDNEIRRMGGAGIHINEPAQVIGLEIAGNRIQECGRDTGRDVGNAAVRGGIVLRGVAQCSIHANHIERCGIELAEVAAFGIDLDSVIDLRITSNTIRENGSARAYVDSGGIRLEEVYGSVMIDQNQITGNHGPALHWMNLARGKTTMPFLNDVYMSSKVNEQFAATDAMMGDRLSKGAPSIALIQNNVIEYRGGEDDPIVYLTYIDELTFSANSCRTQSRSMNQLAEFQWIGYGVIANNLLFGGLEVSISVQDLGEGAILGNVGDKPIQVYPLHASIERGLNRPAIV